MPNYRELWESGELARVAQSCRSAGELARRLGTTCDALVSGLRRVRMNGHAVPLIAEMLGGDPPVRLVQAEPPLVVDQWDEPTDPWRTMPVSEEPASEPEPLRPVDEHRLQRRIRELTGERKALLEQMRQLEDAVSVSQDAAQVSIPPIRLSQHAAGRREATAVALLSDLHIEEEVRPEQVAGLNEFNLDIAKRRLMRVFEGIAWLIRHHRQAFHIDTLVLAAMGDLISGHIHDDLVESTSLSPVQAIAMIDQWLDDGIQFLLGDSDLGRLIIPWVDGNHDRLTKETRVATRTRHSLGWLAGINLARRYQGNPRVEFHIADSPLLYLDIYGFTARFMHGDAVRYSGGVGGISVPMNRAISRWDVGKRADWTCFGHFHQLGWGPNYVSNGSLIGYGPFSQWIAAAYEAPAQAFFLVDSKRGRCMMTPIWADE